MGRLLLVILLVTTFATPYASPAQAQAQGSGQELVWNDEGDTFATFGANESVTIGYGRILHACDYLFPTADVYIQRYAPSIGAELLDITGQQNTVIGATGGFFSDMIAITKPSGAIGNGRYTVVYDECQDGKLDPIDAVFVDAFEVALPSTLPPIDPAIEQLKFRARSIVLIIEVTLLELELYEKYQELQQAIECSLSVAACVGDMIADQITDTILEQISILTGLPTDPKVVAADATSDTLNHWRGIAADPPDPAFRQHTVIERATPIDPQTDDPLIAAEVALGNAYLTEGALAEALLHALERYQGATAANDGDWALVHARDIQNFSTLMASQLANTNAVASDLIDAIGARGLDIDRVSETLSPHRQRIASSGFLPDEERLLLNLGMTQADVDALRAEIATGTGTVSESELIDALDNLIAENTAAIPDVLALASEMNVIIAAVLADPATTGEFPVAMAGGPYNGIEGEPITLVGSASTSADTIVAYDWDLDGDGVFNDASGEVVSHTFPTAFQGFVGLRVTDSTGLTGTSHAAVAIADANGAPEIQTYTPASAIATIIAGTGQTFSIDTTDADGDTIDITWTVDGVEQGSGAAFVYRPTSADIGTHLVQAVVADDNPRGGLTRQTWAALVRHPDADGDGWDANVDCDDANAFVNLDASEIVGNGRDDDCDPDTSDELLDADGDGFNQAIDCDDNDAEVYPGAFEIGFNGKDDYCNPATLDEILSEFPGYTLVESITVPATGETIASATTLAAGLNYKLRASGTLTIDGIVWADAEYTFNPDNTGVNDSCSSASIDDVGIQLNGLQDGSGKLPKWGAFNAEHVYTIDFAGNNAPLSIRYVDCDHANNSGSLTLEVWEQNNFCDSQSPRPAVGKIVVSHDEWPLAALGMIFAPTASRFAINVACWFTGGVPGNFLVYSINGGVASAMLAETMINAGHTWTVGFVDFTLENLLQYDAVFLAGTGADNTVLIDYVQAGGNVYVAGGTANGCDATTWNPFLNAFDLSFGPCFNSLRGVLPIESDHPVFDGVVSLYQELGNNVLDLEPADPRSAVIAFSEDIGLFGVYDESSGATGSISVDAGDNQVVDRGTPVSLPPATFTGAAGATGAAAIDWGDGITSAGSVSAASGSGTVAASHTYTSAGSYTVTVTVRDENGYSGSDTFLVTVNERNLPPTLSGISDLTLSEGTSLVVGITAVDPDGQPVTISTDGLPAFASFVDHGDGTGALYISPGDSDAGSVTGITVAASVGEQSTVGTFSITVTDVANHQPLADAGPDQTVDEIDTVTLNAAGSSDVDGDSLTYFWQVLVSAGPAITLSSATSATPTFATTDDGVYVLQVTVADGSGGSDTDDVTVVDGNLAPAIAGVSTSSPATQGQDVTITVDASDPAGAADPLTVRFDCDGNGAYERASGVCSFSETGDYLVSVRVLDDDGGVAFGSAEVSVAAETNAPPDVTLTGNTAIRLGEAFSGTGSIVDPDSTSWTATVDFGDGSGHLPLTINPDNTFNVSHVFTAAGSYTVAVCVTDDRSNVRCASLAVTVTATAERYAIFAGRTDCGNDSTNAIHWSGSSTSITGDVHSNSGIKISGSKHRVDGATTYRCDTHISGSKHTFTSGVTKVSQQRPWPSAVAASDFSCDLTVHGKLDLSKDGQWWIGNKKSSRKLKTMTLCADSITLSGSNITGTVTLVARQVHISGSGLQLTGDQHDVLAFGTGSHDPIKISGSGHQLSGDLISRSGGIDLSGANNLLDGSVIGWTVKLSGSAWAVTAGD